MSGWTIYLFTRLDVVQFAAGMLLFFCFAAIVAAAICHFMSLGDVEKWHARVKDRPSDEDYRGYLVEALGWEKVRTRVFHIGIPLASLLLLVVCLVPNTKEAVAIYLLPKIANNEQVQQLPDKAMQFMNGKLDEWLKDMQKSEKK